MIYPMLLAVFFVSAFLAAQHAANRYGVLAGFGAFAVVLCLSVLAARTMNREIGSEGCESYGVHAGNC